MAIYRLPFDNDTTWQPGPGNWDNPNHHHPDFQAYAFDLGHAIGGKVRAARGGIVLLAIGDRSCNTANVKAGDPCFNAPGEGNVVAIRHRDNTVAAYCHLKKGKVFVHKGQHVQQGTIIAESGNTGNSFGPHLHFEVRAHWEDISDLKTQGPTIPVQFEDLKHVAWRPRGSDVFASNNVVLRQEAWRWCRKCRGLFFGDSPQEGSWRGLCPAGEVHDAEGNNSNFILVFDSKAPGQSGWRRCNRCMGLFFGDMPGSMCPAFGAHTMGASANYVLTKDSPDAPGQKGWRHCSKCQGMFSGVAGSKCPADGGTHTSVGSPKYTLVQMGPGEVQANWRWCNKCKGLFFGGNPGSSCPAGAAHDSVGSWNYVLTHDYLSGNAPGEKDWRLCSKCQGLFFGDSPGSKCPADGAAHRQSGGSYTVVKDQATAPGQKDWRWCKNCQGLFFAGTPGSKCPAGGEHSKTGSGDYSLLF